MVEAGGTLRCSLHKAGVRALPRTCKELNNGPPYPPRKNRHERHTKAPTQGGEEPVHKEPSNFFFKKAGRKNTCKLARHDTDSRHGTSVRQTHPRAVISSQRVDDAVLPPLGREALHRQLRVATPQPGHGHARVDADVVLRAGPILPQLLLHRPPPRRSREPSSPR